MEFRRNKGRYIRHLASIPFVYLIFIPLVLLDLTIELYHHVCFPLYGLKKVNRREFIKVDRHKLKYLNYYEKINCAYCGYANGLLPYAAKIAAETEKYWCGIKHEKMKKDSYKEPAHHKKFLKYGDAKALEKFSKK